MKIKKHTILCIFILFMSVTLYAQKQGEMPTITIHSVESSLPSVLSILADESGFNIVTGPKVNASEKITIHLEDVPIDQAIDMFSNSSKKTLVSATELSQHPGDCLVRNDDGKYYRLKINSNYENDSGRQAYPETLFIDGGIYISETLEFLNSQQLIGDNPEVMITPQSHAIDIDTPFDLKIARAMNDSREF